MDAPSSFDDASPAATHRLTLLVIYITLLASCILCPAMQGSYRLYN